MNFFINLHSGLLFLVRIPVTLLVLFSFLILVVWLIKSKKLPDKFSTPIIYICVALLLFGSVMGFDKLIDPFHHGVVKEIFIIQTKNDPLISVWLTRIFSKRFGGADYDQRIKTFALETEETFIFITCGESFLSDGAGFTLTGLLADNQTGEILKQIDYIN